MKKDNNSVKAKFFRGLSDATRLSILLTLVNGEKAVSDIVNMTRHSQSNISNHLKCLDECGLVKNRRDGKNIYYSLRDEQVKKLLDSSEDIISKVYEHIEACLNYKK